MFDYDLDRKAPTRRLFLASAAAAVGGFALWSWKNPASVVAMANARDKDNEKPKEVTIVLFDDSGKRLKKVSVPKVTKSIDEWQKQLPSGVFDITRNADTEIAYTGKYWNLHDKGLYRCICCATALFDSSTKFESGTGWPSFWPPLAHEHVREIRDTSLGMGRTAVSCT